MIRISPVLRITVGLVLLTVSMLFVADMAGLAPNETKANIDARKKLTEALAVQLSVFAQNHMAGAMQQAIDTLVSRNEDVLSAALYMEHKGIVAQAGEHGAHWVEQADGKSTPTHVRVPIFSGGHSWGNLEATFRAPDGAGLFDTTRGSILKLALFLVLSGFVGYFLLIKRVLRELDPSKVIPARVKATLDALAEGVVILDEHGDIVLANATFTDKVGLSGSAMIGKRISAMAWEDPATGVQAEDPPWRRAIRDRSGHTGIPLALRTGPTAALTFMVNANPIFDGRGKLRGAMATFDDVTELERKNTELGEAMELLQSSQREVEQTNDRLHKLAIEDPLTGCLNRRELFARAEASFEEIRQTGGQIACIMGDIDHFKRINDTYGHAKGDETIRNVAAAMKSALRGNDLLGRYGGEEFCVFLPAAGAAVALKIAERIRCAILESGTELGITASFGVSALEFGAGSVVELIEQADGALYYSKRNGRDRVSDWPAAEKSAASEEAAAQSAAAPREDDSPILSRLACDPRFRPIITRFVTQMEEQLVALERAWASKDFGHLIRLAQWFKGDGGTVGFDVFSEPAQELEQLAREGQGEGIEEAIGALKRLGGRVVVASEGSDGSAGGPSTKGIDSPHESPPPGGAATTRTAPPSGTVAVLPPRTNRSSKSKSGTAETASGEALRRKASA